MNFVFFQQIFRSAPRLAQCLLEVLVVNPSVDYPTLLNATTLAKCLRARLWWDDNHVAKQLDKVGEWQNTSFVSNDPLAGQQISTKLVAAGYVSFNKIANASPIDLEIAAARNSPFGMNV